MKTIVTIVLVAGFLLLVIVPVTEAPIEVEAPAVELDFSSSFPSQLNDAELAALPVVKVYAAEFQVCPALIMSVIQQESEFRSGLIGDRGRSMGLMQVSYIAALDVGYTSSFQEWKKSGLEIETNIKYGVGYLELQHKRYSTAGVYTTAIENVLSSYNAGQPTLKNRWYVQQTLLGRENGRGYFFYLSQLGTGHMTPSSSLPPQEEEIEFLILCQSSVTASRNNVNVVRHGPRSSKMVAITIDDGWDQRLVSEALRILREEGVKCTLFPTGSVIVRSQSTWREALADGHEFGNHTYLHRSLSSLTEEEIRWEIKKWEESYTHIVAGHSQKTSWFRPPKMSGFGNHADTARYSAIIADLGYITVLWSIDIYANIYKIQGTDVDPQKVVDYVLAKVRAGDIILLHFISPDVAALRGIIRGIRAKGLEPVTLKTLLSSP